MGVQILASKLTPTQQQIKRRAEASMLMPNLRYDPSEAMIPAQMQLQKLFEALYTKPVPPPPTTPDIGALRMRDSIDADPYQAPPLAKLLTILPTQTSKTQSPLKNTPIDFGGTNKTIIDGQIKKAYDAYQYGKGQKLYMEGWSDKRAGKKAADKKIRDGERMMEKHASAMDVAHEVGNKGYALEAVKALTDPDFYSVNLASQLPTNLPLMGESVVGGLAGNLISAGGAALGPVGAPIAVTGRGVQAATVADVSHKEAHLEGVGAYAEVYQREVANGRPSAKAHEAANKAYQEAYNKNIALL